MYEYDLFIFLVMRTHIRMAIRIDVPSDFVRFDVQNVQSWGNDFSSFPPETGIDRNNTPEMV